jgi:hypothetical protein
MVESATLPQLITTIGVTDRIQPAHEDGADHGLAEC